MVYPPPAASLDNISSELSSRLHGIKHIALDMDGTIYRGKTLFPFTNPFLELLRRLGISYSFLTNNSSKSTQDYARHLDRLGIVVEPSQIYTSTHATLEFLKTEQPQVRRLFLLGTPSMTGEVKAAGFELSSDSASDEPDAVLVGFDMELGYARLCRAAYWIQQGKPFFATHPDRICPTDEPIVLIDCGAVCSMLAEAVGRPPDAVPGKPDPRMLHGLCQRHGLQPGELAMVGDRLYTDIAMARHAGALGVLVLTGEATAADAAKENPPPDMVVDDLAAFGHALLAAA